MDKVFGVIRHVISGVGAGLVGFGLASGADITQALTSIDSVIGGITFLVGLGASIYAKVKGNKAA